MPQVADPLECNNVTTRGAVHRFEYGGFEALADASRPGRPAFDRPRAPTWPVCPSGLEEPPAGWIRARPGTVVLNNASAHVARAFRGCREELAAVGVEPFYLPLRSPELNDIEREWPSAKYEDYPERVHTTPEAFGNAVDQALARQPTRVKGSTTNFTKAACSPEKTSILALHLLQSALGPRQHLAAPAGSRRTRGTVRHHRRSHHRPPLSDRHSRSRPSITQGCHQLRANEPYSGPLEAA